VPTTSARPPVLAKGTPSEATNSTLSFSAILTPCFLISVLIRRAFWGLTENRKPKTGNGQYL
jgi:hypothetical protein